MIPDLLFVKLKCKQDLPAASGRECRVHVTRRVTNVTLLRRLTASHSQLPGNHVPRRWLRVGIMTGFVTADGAMRHTQGGGSNTSSERHGQLYLEALSHPLLIKISLRHNLCLMLPRETGAARESDRCWQPLIIRNFISENKSSLLRKQTLKRIS